VGVPFERVWLDRMAAQNPSMTIVRTQDNVIKRAMQSHRHPDEHPEHGQEARDADEDGRILDPHIWLDPKRASQMAENIRDALIQADPEHESLYKMNAARLMAEMSTLDAHIRDLFADLAEDPSENRPTFMVFHPAWGYFADAYGLEQAPIELEGKEPSPAELGKLVERAKKRGVSAIFVQPQFSDQSARLIAGQIGAEVVKLDPMARDWADNLRSAARAIHDAVIEKD
jgi:zinc transport system substrate-binding protein